MILFEITECTTHGMQDSFKRETKQFIGPQSYFLNYIVLGQMPK